MLKRRKTEKGGTDRPAPAERRDKRKAAVTEIFTWAAAVSREREKCRKIPKKVVVGWYGIRRMGICSL